MTQPLINIEHTPNPCAIKFLLNREVSPNNPQTFLCIEECVSSSLARKLFSIEGIEMVFFGSDFITIAKVQDASWNKIEPAASIIIVDHLQLGLNIYDRQEKNVNVKLDLAIDEIDKHITQVLDDYIKPAIAMDGGGLIYHGFKDGIVTLTLIGACKGCPQSEVTLKDGIETTLRYHVPEVKQVTTIDAK